MLDASPQIQSSVGAKYFLRRGERIQEVGGGVQPIKLAGRAQLAAGGRSGTLLTPGTAA